MKAIVPPLSALLLILAGLGVAPQLARADVMYQCVDESGHKSFSNIRPSGKGTKCTAMDLGPATTMPGAKPAAPAARTPTPASFPKVGEATQKSRDTDRRRILEGELAAEQRNLEQARKDLAGQEEVLPEERFGPQQRCSAGKDGKQVCVAVGGSGINGAKVEERLQSYKDKVALHERNVEAIQKELAKLR